MDWKYFEKNCFELVSNNYQQYNVTFIPYGKSDSTKADIAVSKNNIIHFYMETKKPKAQCGQFVLLPDNNLDIFNYSPKNKTPINNYSLEIIEYMNNNYKTFKNAGTKGETINIEKEIFQKWITTYYSYKNVEFFISKYNNELVIIPIHKFSDYFDITCKFRVKRSGSRNPVSKDVNLINKAAEKAGYVDLKIQFKEKKCHAISNNKMNNKKLSYGDYTYYFKEIEKNDFIVTKLSNTFNSNVIFSINLKKGQDKIDILTFKKRLLEL